MGCSALWVQGTPTLGLGPRYTNLSGCWYLKPENLDARTWTLGAGLWNVGLWNVGFRDLGIRLRGSLRLG